MTISKIFFSAITFLIIVTKQTAWRYRPKNYTEDREPIIIIATNPSMLAHIPKLYIAKKILNFHIFYLIKTKTCPNLNNLIDWQCKPQNCIQEKTVKHFYCCKLQILNFQLPFQCCNYMNK